MTYSPAFQKAVALILKHEGGYVNDPHDPGGETNFGIAKRSHPTEDIKGMTAVRAAAIYHRDYWQAIQGDALPPALAVIVFDMAVNAGVGAGIKLLQRTLQVPDDGVLGPVTLAKAQAAGASTAVALTRRRILYYSDLPGWPRYRASWTQRTLETLLVAAA